MKKLFIVISIITLTATSCSTDDVSTYETNKQNFQSNSQNKEDSFCLTCRDSLTRENDSIPSEPVKPKKD